jgi:enterobactin synthetase component D
MSDIRPAFRLDVPFGRCVGMAIPPAVSAEVLAGLHPEERQHSLGLGPSRQSAFAAGRLALRAALSDLQLPDAPVLPDPDGAPIMPAGVIGSISHKRTLAVALVARAAPEGVSSVALGVDLEEDRPLRVDISRRVLTDTEQRALAGLSGAARDRAVILRFSLKEAVYKALHGWLGRYISFQEVAIDAIERDGRVAFSGSFEDEASGMRFSVEGFWHPLPGHFLSCALARRV